jgi:hypothetical protein
MTPLSPRPFHNIRLFAALGVISVISYSPCVVLGRALRQRLGFSLNSLVILALLAAAFLSAAAAKQTTIQAALPINVVTTSDAAGNRYRYAATVTVKLPAAVAPLIAAYGVAGRIWLGPKGWEGHASVGVDGSTDVVLSRLLKKGVGHAIPALFR